jgi:hypothetical protein
LKVLALDVSTKTGWAFFQDAQLFAFGLIEKSKPSFEDYGDYPHNFVNVAYDIKQQIITKVFEIKPDVIVIEETNKTGRFGSRHSQKILEFIHCFIVNALPDFDIKYVNTSDWRKILKLSVADTKKLAKPYLKELARLKGELAKADKAHKKQAKAALDLHKKTLKDKCIHGKIDKKSISVAFVNMTHQLAFKKGDNDISDAICLGEAYKRGVKTLTNKDIFEHEAKIILKPSGSSI